MKSRNCKFFALLIAIILCVQPLSALAADEQFVGHNKALFVQTSKVPENVIEYAKQNVNRFILSSIDATHNESYSMGTPFALNNPDNKSKVYYFPIINEDKVVATYRISRYKGQCTGVYSEVLAKELNEMVTSEKSPCYLSVSGNDIICTQNGKTIILMNEKNEPTRNRSAYPKNIEENLETINCFDTVAISNSTVATDFITTSIPSFYTVPFATTACTLETQGSEPWCSAYVCAFIVRCRTENSTEPRASTVMAVAYPYETYSELLTHPLWDADARVYYAGRGYAATLTYSYLPTSSVQSYILAKKPIHMLTCSLSGNHSLALVGYNTPYLTYKIWNPWHSYLELMDQTTLVYTTPGGTDYEWYGRITVD